MGDGVPAHVENAFRSYLRRRKSLYTSTSRFCALRLPHRQQRAHGLHQRKQILQMQQGAARREYDVGIRRGGIGPRRWKGAPPSLPIPVHHTVLAPVVVTAQ